MLVYRIASQQFIEDLSGNGAKLYGGRWNRKGTALVYFASSRALAVLELLVHLNPVDLQRDYALGVFQVPDHLVTQVGLPDRWYTEFVEDDFRRVGSAFVESQQSLWLQVPSVIVPEEYNLLMNPDHSESGMVELISTRKFNFDSRFKLSY